MNAPAASILVVDDEVDVRRLITKRLSLDGFEKEIQKRIDWWAKLKKEQK